MNRWANFWFYNIGVNVVPAITQSKTIRRGFNWNKWQTEELPSTEFEKMKDDGYFDDGIAIVCGCRIWRGVYKGKYFSAIDLDNALAIEEFCTRDGNKHHSSLEELAQNTLVEQHPDNPTKAHIYFISESRPLITKASDNRTTTNDRDTADLINSNKIPAFEVKGFGTLMFCSPSLHKSGQRYQIIKTPTKVPTVLNTAATQELENHFDNICKKYGLSYLENAGSGGNGKSLTPIQNLFQERTRIYEGQNRHEALMRAMESLIARNRNILSLEEIIELSRKWNEQHCVPPLDDREFERQWRDATKFIADKHNDNDDAAQEEQVENKNKKTTTIYVQKHREAGQLAEAIIVGGRPYFAINVPKLGNPGETSSVVLQDSIEFISGGGDKGSDNDDTTTTTTTTVLLLKPLEYMSYINKPYAFKSREEFEEYIKKVKSETLDTLYQKVKAVWRKYIDADDAHISICAADTIFSYFQDKMGMTHYLFFIGGNGSGKSNNLQVLHFLAYRNMTSTDITAANIYQLLGSLDEGQATLCEDEADNVDENHEKMRIYKNGYTVGFPVLRTDTTYGRKQYKFNTFCFKAFAAEKLPDIMQAKGFNQRVVELYCTFGFPKYDISEISSPAGAEEYQSLLDELMELRKILLIYRLIHFNDKVPNIELNISNREKQLFKPVLRVFQGTKAFDELIPIVSGFVSQKRASNADTLAAELYKVVKTQTKHESSLELLTDDIWRLLISNTDAQEVKNKAQTFDFGELGILSQKDIVKVLVETFRAKKDRAAKSRKKTLIFNQDILDKLAVNYEVDIQINLKKRRGSEEEFDVGMSRYIDRESSSNHGNHGNHSGDGHATSKQEGDTEHRTLEQKNKENLKYILDNDINSTTENQSYSAVDSINGYNGYDGSNNNLYDSSKTNDNNKSTITTTFTPLDLEEQKHRAAIVRSAQGYPCVYCNGFESKYQEDYERHVLTKHPNHLPCPTDEELDLNGGRIMRGGRSG
jgi:hypothetical protein